MNEWKKRVEAGSAASRSRGNLGVLAAFVALVIIVLAIAAYQTSIAPRALASEKTEGAAAVQAGARPALPPEVSVSEAAAKRKAGAFILDVRTPEEWNEYHVPGSTLIPLNELGNRLAEVPKDKEVVVVCRSGNRSATGRDLLLKAGYPQVTSLAKGLTAWRSSGQPVE